jgi:uracil phosphoribosyltransferase
MKELKHNYGDQVHIIDDLYLTTRLADLSRPETKQPYVTEIVKDLYTHLIRYVISKEFPKLETNVTTRMFAISKYGVWRGEVVDKNARAISVNLARAGTVPSQICYETLNNIIDPDRVRQDHIFVSRKVDDQEKVVGTDFHGSKIGGGKQDAIVLFPDPMGATGGSLVEVYKHYQEQVKGQAFKFICMNMIVTSEFIQKIKAEAPEMIIYTLRLDRGASSEEVRSSVPGTQLAEEKGLTDIQYIVPGAGGVGEIMNNSYC